MELTNDFVVAVPVEHAWEVLTDVERIAPCLPGDELQEVEGDEYRGIVKVKVGPITASYRGTARFEEKDPVAHRGVLRAEGRETRGQGNASATITAVLSPSGDGTKVEVVTDLAITGKVAQFGRGVLADVSGKLLAQFVHNLETMVLAPDASPAESEAAQEAAPKAAPKDAHKTTPAKAAATHKAAASKAAGDAKPARSRAAAKAAAAAAAVASNGAAESGPAAAAGGEEAATASVGDAGSDPAEAAATVRLIQSAPVEPVDLGRIAGPSVAKRLIPFASIAGALFLIRVIVYALRRRKR